MEGVGRSRCLENGTWTPPPTCRGRENTSMCFREGTLTFFLGRLLTDCHLCTWRYAAFLAFQSFPWVLLLHLQQIHYLLCSCCFCLILLFNTSCACVQFVDVGWSCHGDCLYAIFFHQWRLGKDTVHVVQLKRKSWPQKLFPPAVTWLMHYNTHVLTCDSTLYMYICRVLSVAWIQPCYY